MSKSPLGRYDTSRVEHTFTQTDHGFAVLDAVYIDTSSIWEKAQSDDPDTLASGIVTKVIDAHTFQLGFSGVFTISSHGLSVGHYYYLSDASPGALAIIEPAVYSQALIQALNANTVRILEFRPLLTASGGASGSGGGRIIVAETVLENPATSLDVTGLSIDADDTYYFELLLLRNAASNINIDLRFNGDASEADYSLRSNSSGNSSGESTMGLSAANLVGYFGNIKKTITSTDTVEIIASFVSADGDLDAAGIRRGYPADTDLTQFSFIASVADGLGIGTSLKVWKETN